MMTWSHVRKSVIVTGVTPGSLGADTVRVLTLHDPLLLILASRSTEKISQVIADVSIKSSTIVKTLELDLASLPSVRAAAGKVLEWTTSVDAVIETAGVMAVPTYQVNDDGLEMTFAVNHLGHFLFTNLLMERLLAAKDGGVVVPFTGEAHKRASLNVEDVNFDVSLALSNTRGFEY
jgi:NAD(P)-dependent dehydrogenase (short-subunit alcohol dehydrogenase family)